MLLLGLIIKCSILIEFLSPRRFSDEVYNIIWSLSMHIHILLPKITYMLSICCLKFWFQICFTILLYSFYLGFVIFVLLKIFFKTEREGQSSYSPLHSPTWLLQQYQAKNAIPDLLQRSQEPSNLSHSHCLSGSVVAGSWSLERKLGIEPSSLGATSVF